MRSTSVNKIKILSCLISVLVFLTQVIPKTEFTSAGEHRLPEWNIENNILNIGLSSSQNTQNIIRQNSGINLSPANMYFDKYDMLSLPIIIDSKKIYGGGFSYTNMYKAFLTVHFSTCT
jgi:hypothetical protein